MTKPHNKPRFPTINFRFLLMTSWTCLPTTSCMVLIRSNRQTCLNEDYSCLPAVQYLSVREQYR